MSKDNSNLSLESFQEAKDIINKTKVKLPTLEPQIEPRTLLSMYSYIGRLAWLEILSKVSTDEPFEE